jgi:hypothetical protein
VNTATDRARSFFRTQAASVGAVNHDAVIERLKRFEAYGFKPKTTLSAIQDAMIVADADMQEGIYDLMAEVAPKVHAAFRDEMIPLAEDVLAKWPVRTGLSRSLITLRLSVDGGIARYTIRSAAPYTTFIRFGRNSTPTGYQRGTNAWEALATDPLKPALRRMAEVVHG